MLERKFGDHANWKLILKRHYAQTFMDSETFKGHLTLLQMDQVAGPLLKSRVSMNFALLGMVILGYISFL